MTAVAVSIRGSTVTRVNDAEALGSVWTDLAGTAAVLEIEAFYQNTKAVSEKVKTTESGVKYYNSVASHDYTAGGGRTALLKMAVTSFTNLNNTPATSMIAEIGSGDRSNYYRYYLYTDVTYPPDRSWLFIPINPNIAGYVDATPASAPTLTTIDYYGHAATMKTTAAKAENVVMDAIDFIDTGGGLLLVSGDGADADGKLADFLAFDEGTATNRYGMWTQREGILFVLATHTIGSATATEFTDSLFTVVFPDGRYDAGFVGMAYDLQNASTIITLSDGLFVSKGSKSGSADTRQDHTASGTSGVMTQSAVTFNQFRNWTLTSAVSLIDCIFLGGELITQAGGTITDGVLSEGTGTHYILATNPTLISGCNFTQGAGGHAVRCDTVGTYDWTGNLDTGYTGTRGTNLTSSSGSVDAMFYNNSGGLITLNVDATGQAPSVRNGAGATTQVNTSVQISILVQDEAKNPILNAQTSVFLADSPFTQLMNEDTLSSGLAQETYSGATPVAVVVKVRKSETTDSPRYYAFSDVQTISGTGLTLTVTLKVNPFI